MTDHVHISGGYVMPWVTVEPEGKWVPLNRLTQEEIAVLQNEKLKEIERAEAKKHEMQIEIAGEVAGCIIFIFLSFIFIKWMTRKIRQRSKSIIIYTANKYHLMYKLCPYCKERIKSTASVCKHCLRNLL